MKHLVTLAVLLTLAVDSFSQVCYYPIAEGNVWDFGASYQQWVAIGDTLLPDGKMYAVLQETHYHQNKYLRQEGDSVFWGANLYYDFTRMPGDTIWQTSNTVKCLSARGDTTIFGRNLRWWEFTRIVFVGPTAGGDVEIVVDSIGMVYYWESFDFYFQPWVLQGAVIDGKRYGTINSLEENRSREIPTESALMQNYPNPFNPSTKIQFTIVNPRLPHKAQDGGQGQLTIVKVYDVLGRNVATLVNEIKKPGTYTVEFNDSNLASGVYFYRIQVGDFVQSKRLLLLK